MEETLRFQLIEIAKLFEVATGVSPAGVGKRALKDNTFFARLAAEQGFTVKTYDRLVAWFSENWPADHDWPADVPRPTAPTPEDLSGDSFELARRRA